MRDLRPQVVLAFRTRHGVLGWARAAPTGSLTRDNSEDVSKIAEQRPDVLDEAHDYQLVTYEHDDINQQVNIRLTPHVQYSLGLTHRLPGTEADQDRNTDETRR